MQFAALQSSDCFKNEGGVRLLRESLSVIQCEKSQEKECSFKKGFVEMAK